MIKFVIQEYSVNGISFTEYESGWEAQLNNCTGFGKTCNKALEDLEFKLKLAEKKVREFHRG